MNTVTPITPRLHPLLATAALTVTAFSLAGIAALTGVLPMSKAASGVAAPTVAPMAAFVPAVSPAPTFAVPQASSEQKPAAKSAPKPSVKPVTKSAAPVVKAAPALEIAQVPTPAPATPILMPPTVAAPVPCATCGVIDKLREVPQEGEGSGIGAVAGGVLGGLLGNQIGGGSGNKIATVLGVAGGAYAGHQVEKSRNKTMRYEIGVRMDDGSIRTLMQDSQPVWRSGERVRLENGVLTRETAPAAPPMAVPAYDRT